MESPGNYSETFSAYAIDLKLTSEKVYEIVTVEGKLLEFLTVAVQIPFNCYTIAVFPFYGNGETFV